VLINFKQNEPIAARIKNEIDINQARVDESMLYSGKPFKSIIMTIILTMCVK